MEILTRNLSILLGMIASFGVGAVYAWSLLVDSVQDETDGKLQFRLADAISLLTLFAFAFSLVAALFGWYQVDGFGSSGNHWPRWADWLVASWTWMIPLGVVPILWLGAVRMLQKRRVKNACKRIVYTSFLSPIAILLSVVLAFAVFLYFRDVEFPRSIPHLVPFAIATVIAWPFLKLVSKWCLSDKTKLRGILNEKE